MSDFDLNAPVHFIINRSDAIGDLVLSLPVAQALKNHYSNSKVSIIVSERNREVVEHCPFVDSHILFSKSNKFKFFHDFKKSISEELTIFIHLGGSQLPIFVSLLLGVKHRYGLKNKMAGVLLNEGIRQSRSRALMSEVDYNLLIINSLVPTPLRDSSKVLVANLCPEHGENFNTLIRNNHKTRINEFLGAKKKIITKVISP